MGLCVFGGVDGVCRLFDNIVFSFLSFSTFSSSFDVSISMKSGSVIELVVHAPLSDRVAIFPSVMKEADDTEGKRLKYWRRHASLDQNSPSHRFRKKIDGTIIQWISWGRTMYRRTQINLLCRLKSP